MNEAATRPARPLTVGQVAERLGCSVDKVYQLLDDGRLPGARRLDPDRTRSPWRIPPASVELYLVTATGQAKTARASAGGC